MKIESSPPPTYSFSSLPGDILPLIIRLAIKSIRSLVFVSKTWNDLSVKEITDQTTTTFHLSLSHMENSFNCPGLLTNNFQFPSPTTLSELRSCIISLMETKADLLYTIQGNAISSLNDRVEIGDPGFAYEIYLYAQRKNILLELSRQDQLQFLSLSANFLANKIVSPYPLSAHSNRSILLYMSALCYKGLYQRAFALIPHLDLGFPPYIFDDVINMAIQGRDIDLAYSIFTVKNSFSKISITMVDNIFDLALELNRFDILLSLSNDFCETIGDSPKLAVIAKNMVACGLPQNAIQFVIQFAPRERIPYCLTCMALAAVERGYSKELLSALQPLSSYRNYHPDFFFPIAKTFATQGLSDIAFQMAEEYPPDSPEKNKIYANIALHAHDNNHPDLFEKAFNLIDNDGLKKMLTSTKGNPIFRHFCDLPY